MEDSVADFPSDGVDHVADAGVVARRRGGAPMPRWSTLDAAPRTANVLRSLIIQLLPTIRVQ